MTMNIKDAKKAKNKLEEDIRILIHGFEENTGLQIQNIYIDRYIANTLYTIRTDITL